MVWRARRNLGWPTGTRRRRTLRSDLLQSALYSVAARSQRWNRKCPAFEPRAALDGGPDGLDAYRALAELLPRLLRPGGHALLEIGAGPGAAVEPLFRALKLCGLHPIWPEFPVLWCCEKP